MSIREMVDRIEILAKKSTNQSPIRGGDERSLFFILHPFAFRVFSFFQNWPLEIRPGHRG